jgi:Mrp family chromosome partitioning ATPase
MGNAGTGSTWSVTDPIRFEPTITRAVVRYRAVVVAAALLGLLAGIVFGLVGPATYEACAQVTVPRQLSLSEQAAEEYLDSQVMLLESVEVARRATDLAAAAVGPGELAVTDFIGADRSLNIVPPSADSSGSYGGSIITVSFTSSSERVARAAVNAVLTAFDNVRTAMITKQGAAVIAGIDTAIAASTSSDQRGVLLERRSQVLVNQQIDLARHPVTTWAAEPMGSGGTWLRGAGIGALVGILAGAAGAFARACAHRRLSDPLEPETVYGARLIGEIPAVPRRDGQPHGLARWLRDAFVGHRRATVHGPVPLSADIADERFAESFRFAARCLERAVAEPGGGISVAVTSPLAGAGRTTVVANLARALADGGTRVLAVDASGGELTAALAPDTPVTDGFRQVLAGRRGLACCVLHPASNPSCAVLAAGSDGVTRMSGAALSEAVRGLLEAARSEFEIVLVDGPPLLESSDAVALVEHADAVVVVAGHDEPLSDHLDLARRLDALGLAPTGYVYTLAPRRRVPVEDRVAETVGALGPFRAR